MVRTKQAEVKVDILDPCVTVWADIVLQDEDGVQELLIIRKAIEGNEALHRDRVVFSRAYDDLWKIDEKLASDVTEFTRIADHLVEHEVKAMYKEVEHIAAEKRGEIVAFEEPFIERPDHYSRTGYKPEDVIEEVYGNIHSEGAYVAMWVAFAMKHLLRAGLKGDAKEDITKAYTYLRKALYDRF